jgi:hypothetical protein
VQEYDDQAYQDIYYVADSFEDAMDKFRRWVSQNLTRPVEMRFNPYTQTIEVNPGGQNENSMQVFFVVEHLWVAVGGLSCYQVRQTIQSGQNQLQYISEPVKAFSNSINSISLLAITCRTCHFLLPDATLSHMVKECRKLFSAFYVVKNVTKSPTFHRFC